MTYEKDNNHTLALIGEHLNMGKYSWKYQNSNVSGISHVLGHTSSNSTAKWTVGLRDFYNDNNAGKDFRDFVKKTTQNTKTLFASKSKGVSAS